MLVYVIKVEFMCVGLLSGYLEEVPLATLTVICWVIKWVIRGQLVCTLSNF